MTRFALLLASSAAGLVLAGAAQAGVCSGEIMALQKQMEDTPTMADTGTTAPNPDAGAAPLTQPETAAAQPGATIGAPPSSDAGGGQDEAHAAPGGSGEAGSTPGSDKLPLPAARGGVLAENGADIPPPSPSEPMDSDAAQAAQLNTAAGTDATGTDLTGKEAAAQTLARARALDEAGDEAGCMTAINEAKSQLTAP